MLTMQITYYQDKYFYYFRKPAGVASTFGLKKSFLDILLESQDLNIKAIMTWQKEMFDKNEEFWLLNRLDNNTSGLLYFAKTPLFKTKYKSVQQNLNIQKYYIADVYWKYLPESQKISYPIWHHKNSNDRMVVILDTKQTTKIKWNKINYVDTYIEKLYYDQENNISTLLVSISKWIRHQIRAHLSSIWYPVIWEKIYVKTKKHGHLHLYSIWMEIKEI